MTRENKVVRLDKLQKKIQFSGGKKLNILVDLIMKVFVCTSFPPHEHTEVKIQHALLVPHSFRLQCSAVAQIDFTCWVWAPVSGSTKFSHWLAVDNSNQEFFGYLYMTSTSWTVWWYASQGLVWANKKDPPIWLKYG